MSLPDGIAPESEVVLHHAPHHPPVSGRWRRRMAIGLIVVIAVGGAGVAAGVHYGFLPNPVVARDPKASGHGNLSAGPAASVKASVIHPKRDPSVQLTAERIATVEPYYQADLKARASGLVRAVYKDIGDHVNRGDLLIEIDVPEAVQEVAQKTAVVGQRRQELRVSTALRKNAESGRDVAKATAHEKLALVAQAEATRDFRQTRLARLRKLAATDTVVAGVIDEEERDYKASEAAVDAARAAVERAKADAAETEAKIEAATADIDLKVALVEVALRDLGRARAVADYARVVAPFDGVIVRQTVDPGSFVQNATTGQSEALISVARTDMVTIVAQFPDTVAAFVAADTEAEVTISNLPGATLHGKVTRFTPSIQNSDRTIRVEVDLFNGSEADYRRIVGRVVGAELAPLSAAGPVGAVAARLVRADLLTGLHKGDSDLLPTGTATGSPADAAVRLLPGMSGSVKLLLHRFHDGCVLPSTAVYSRTGKPYILVVENGVTKQYPVRVQLNDGRVAKVAFVTVRKDAAGTAYEVLTELTGQEQVVAIRQLEIGDGAAVLTIPGTW